MKVIITTLLLYYLVGILGQPVKTQIRHHITPEELCLWSSLDKGRLTIQEDQLIIEEIPGSDGFSIVSPESYSGNIKINYQVKALSEASVLIVLFHASDIGKSNAITLPPEGAHGMEIWTWRTKLEHYNISFNNRSHGNTPFFYKNISPYQKGFHQYASTNMMDVGNWYNIEIVLKNELLLFKINDTIVFEQQDCHPLSGGHLVLRVSGINQDQIILAKAAIKDLVITLE